MFVVVFGVPALASTVFRVPVLAVDGAGLRMPLMGVRLGWQDIARVRQAHGPFRPVLLIVPTDPSAVLGRMRPWLRAEGQASMARYGTPIVMAQQSMDGTLAEVESAIAAFRPTPPAGSGPAAAVERPSPPPDATESGSGGPAASA